MKILFAPKLHWGFLGLLFLIPTCLVLLSARPISTSKPISAHKESAPTQGQVVGVELYYQQLENQQLRVILTKYATPNYFSAPAFETVALHEREAFMLHGTLQLEQECIEDIAPSDTQACGENPGLKKITYSAITNLLPMPGGYDITWGQCCLNETFIVNVESYKPVDLALSVYLPDPMNTELNAMPHLASLPPHLICANQNQSLQIEAKDPDGDRVTYSFSSPFSSESIHEHQATVGMPMLSDEAAQVLPKLTGRPPFKAIPYKQGFSAQHPLPEEHCQLSEQSGELSIESSLSGQYLIGLTLRDFRKEQLMSEHQCLWLLEIQ